MYLWCIYVCLCICIYIYAIIIITVYGIITIIVIIIIYEWNKHMAAIVIGDVSNLSIAFNKNNLCGIKDAVESLFNIFIVCLIWGRRGIKKNIIWIF